MRKKAELDSLKCDHEPVILQLESVIKSKIIGKVDTIYRSKGQRVLESYTASAPSN